MSNKNYYEILGVEKNASEEEIKKAFRSLSKQYHPDKQIDKTEEEKKKSEEVFKEINEAYSILSDPDKKNNYDNFGDANHNSDIDDFINMAAMHFNMQNKPKNVATVQIKIDVTTKELYYGTKKNISFNAKRVCSTCEGKKFVESEGGKLKKCEYCDGTGMIMSNGGNMFSMQPCPKCHGAGHFIENGCKHCNSTGYEMKTEEIELSIPKGAPNGSYSVFNEKGYEEIINGKKVRGSVAIFINEIEDENFIRVGNDLHYNYEASIFDCLLGNEITIENIDGKKHKFKLKVGTEFDEKYRLSGIGMPIFNSDKFGDLYVHIKYNLPKVLNEKQIKLINELKEISNG